MSRNRWCATTASTGSYALVHVVPVEDLREHDLSVRCWCGPRLATLHSTGAVWSHNSIDGRELVEEHGVQ